MNNGVNDELLELFLTLVRIDATSGKEKPVADFIQNFVSDIGIPSYVDDAASLSGGNTGNVVVQVKGGGDFVLMSHMDTPRSTAGVKPQLLVDRVTSDGTTILGVDDRGGIASLLWALKKAVKEDCIKPCTFLFTVCEETTLAGSQFFEPTCELTHGYAFDSHLSPGMFVNETCGAISFRIIIHGLSSHAGVAPEKGINAIQIAMEGLRRFPFGRIDASTTANIGIINGGQATNVVPELVTLEGEIRTDLILTGEKMMAEVIADFEKTAKRYGGNVEFKWWWDFKPYCITPDLTPYRRLERLFSHLSLPMQGVKSMGGSDANNMNAKGLPTINLGVGAKNPHSIDEYILYSELQQAADMAFALITII